MAKTRSFDDLDETELKSLKKIRFTEARAKKLGAAYLARTTSPKEWLGVLKFFEKLPDKPKLPKLIRDLSGIDSRALRSFKRLTSIEDEDFDRWVAAGLSLSMLRLLGIAWSRTKTGDERSQKRQTRIRELANRAIAEGWTVRELERKLDPRKSRKTEKETELQVYFSKLASLLADIEDSDDSSESADPRTESRLAGVAEEYRRGRRRNSKPLSKDQREKLAAAVLEVAKLQQSGSGGEAREK